MAAVEVPIVVAVIVALRTDWTPVADWALIDVEVRGVGTAATPLIGAYSRFGWNHPGPGMWYLLAVPTRLLGGSPSALLAAAAVAHGIAAAGAVLTAWRRGGALLGGLTTLVVAALLRSLGTGFLVDPWNPFVPIVALLWFLLAVWDGALGSPRGTVAAVVVGSLAVQSHVAFAPVVLATGAVAGVVAAWRRRRDGAELRRRWHPGWLIGLWCAVVVLWLPPVLQQVTGGRGNLGEVAAFAVGGAGDDTADAAAGLDTTVGVEAAARLVVRDVVVGPRWLVGPVEAWRVAVATEPWWLLAVPLAALAVVGWLGRRRIDVLAAQLLAATALVAVTVGTAAIRGFAFDWLTRATWPVGAFVALMVGWGAASVVLDRVAWRPAPTTWRVLGAGTLAVAVALALPAIGSGGTATPPQWAFSAPTGAVVDQTAAWLADHPAASVRVVDLGAGVVATGLLAGLDRAGVPIVVSDEQADVLLPGRATAGEDGAARDLLVVAGDDAIAAMAARPGMVQVAAMTPSAAEADAGVPSIGVFTAG